MVPLAGLKLHLEQKMAAVPMVHQEPLWQVVDDHLACAYEIVPGQLELEPVPKPADVISQRSAQGGQYYIGPLDPSISNWALLHNTTLYAII